MRSIRLNTNIKVILAVVISFFVLYLLYSQLYLKNREEDMIQTRYRVLDNMGENVKAKVDSYEKNAGTYLGEVLNNECKEGYEEIICFTNNPNEEESVNIIRKQAKTDKLDVSEIRNIDQIDLKKIISKYSKTYNADLVYIGWTINPLDTVTRNRRNFKNYVIYKTSDLAEKPVNSFTIKGDSLLFVSGFLEFYLPSELLVKNIERPDVFDQTLLIANDVVLYHTTNKDLKLITVQSVGRDGSKKTFQLVPESGSDTLNLPGNGTMKHTTIHADQCFNIKMPDGRYKLFLKPIRIGQQDWFIGGMVNIAKFEKEKHSIPTWTIVFLSLIFVLILLSLPFVKLWAMSKTELIGRRTIFHIAISLLLGFTFVTFYLFFQQYYFSRTGDRNQELKDLSVMITNSLNTELKNIYDVVSKVDKTMNEKLNKRQETSIYDKIFADTSTWKIKGYPYFDYIYWLDKTGMQKYEITPFSNKEQLQNYDFRDYFKRYDEWYANYRMPRSDANRLPDSVKFFLESIVSVTSGDYKAAFSTKSVLGNKTRIVLTGRLNSLIDPILPKGYSFCIIDPNGEVLFHSNKYQNTAENFILECNDDRNIRAAIYSESPRHLNVNYYNDPYRIYIEPMKGLPLFLVTMYDLKMEYAFQAQSFITTSMLVIALFIYFFLQLIIFMFLKRMFTRPDEPDSNQRIEFSKLKQSKLHEYIRLIALSLYSLAALYWLVFLMPAALAIIAVFMIAAVLFSIILFRLHEYKYKSRVSIGFLIFNSLVFVILLVIAFLISAQKNPLFWIFLVLLGLMVRINFTEWFNKVTAREWDPGKTYSRLIFVLLIALGVVPVLRFYQVAVNIENENQVRLTQLELAKSRENRNDTYDRYYERISDTIETADDFRDDVHKSRMDCGEYCYFWNSTEIDDLGDTVPEKCTRMQEIDSLLNQVRPVYSDPVSISSKYLSIDNISGRNFNWTFHDDSVKLVYSSLNEDIYRQQPKTTSVTSVVPHTSILFPFSPHTRYKAVKVSLFFLILIFILMVGYRIILLSTRKLFGLSLMGDMLIPAPDASIKKLINSGTPVLIINPSGLTGFQDLLKIIRKDYNTVDLEWNTTTVYDQSKTLLISDLMIDRFDPEKFGNKIETIFFQLEKHPGLLIVTEINPQKVALFYEEKARVGKFASRSDKDADADQAAYRKTYYKFRSLLNKLARVDVPLDYKGKDGSAVRTEKPETLFTEMGDIYCKNIVENCSPEELIVLLDLSGDTIANVTNVNTVKRLLSKGLLKEENEDIVIRYREFEMYLDKNFTSKYRRELTTEAGEESGKWSGYKTAILLISIILLAFIFISNQQFLSNITKLVATVGASLLAITNLFNMVTKKNS
jgi:hypothetical protein